MRACLLERLREMGFGPAHAETLRRVQDRVLALECLRKGAGGMYKPNNPLMTTSFVTFCNHATFLTIAAVDGNYQQFIGRGATKLYGENAPPWSQYNVTDNIFRRARGNYRIKETNVWCDILEEQARNSDETGICGIGPEEAQARANDGYVVVAAWKNLKEELVDNAPHYATVRPGAAYDSEKGPLLANVGAFNGIYRAGDREAFWTHFRAIKWYYNRNQKFRENYKRWDDLK
jgi:hypothetical protein